MKILVVDDDKTTESLFNQSFKEEINEGIFDFMFVMTAEDALDKIKIAKKTHVVFILSDAISGLHLLKTLKKSYPHIPVMMVTAYEDETRHNKAIKYQADGFINKPFDFSSLKEKILRYFPKTTLSKKSCKKSKILVVDDEPSLEALIRQRFKKRIQDKEMEFIFTSNEKKALKILHQDKEIGIILTNVNMKEMDGSTFLNKLKTHDRIYRIVVISFYGDMENIRKSMNLGASDFITKPIDLNDLEKTLEKITRNYHCLQEGAKAQNKMVEYQKELEIANTIQQAFIPNNFKPFGKSKAVDIYGKMFSAMHIGGDFFDFFKIGDDKLGFVVADVSGKGVPASLFMVMSQVLIRSKALANPSPKDCLKEVSNYLCKRNESIMFVTSFYGILNINTGVLSYSDAGHLPPFILSQSGEVSELEKKCGIALGVLDEVDQQDFLYEEQTYQLKQGDTIILYTDGVTEALNKKGDFYTKENLKKVIENLHVKDLPNLVNHIKLEIDTFADGLSQYDDITLLCIRWNGPK